MEILLLPLQIFVLRAREKDRGAWIHTHTLLVLTLLGVILELSDRIPFLDRHDPGFVIFGGRSQPGEGKTFFP